MDYEIWLETVAALVARHLHLSLVDTYFGEVETSKAVHEEGIEPYEAVNDFAEKYDLEFLGSNMFECIPKLTALHQEAILSDSQPGFSM